MATGKQDHLHQRQCKVKDSFVFQVFSLSHSPPALRQDRQHTARHRGYRPHLALAPWKPFPLLLRPPASGSFDQPPPHF